MTSKFTVDNVICRIFDDQDRLRDYFKLSKFKKGNASGQGSYESVCQSELISLEEIDWAKLQKYIGDMIIYPELPAPLPSYHQSWTNLDIYYVQQGSDDDQQTLYLVKQAHQFPAAVEAQLFDLNLNRGARPSIDFVVGKVGFDVPGHMRRSRDLTLTPDPSARSR